MQLQLKFKSAAIASLKHKKAKALKSNHPSSFNFVVVLYVIMWECFHHSGTRLHCRPPKQQLDTEWINTVHGNTGVGNVSNRMNCRMYQFLYFPYEDWTESVSSWSWILEPTTAKMCAGSRQSLHTECRDIRGVTTGSGNLSANSCVGTCELRSC